MRRQFFPICILATLLLPIPATAESGYDAWLRYAALPDAVAKPYHDTLPAVVVVLGDAAPVRSAGDEIVRGVRGMLGRTLRRDDRIPREASIVIGTRARLKEAAPALRLTEALEADGVYLAIV